MRLLSTKEGSSLRTLPDDFVLVTGSGKTYSKADLLEEARSGLTYVRTPTGWRYVFGQSFAPLFIWRC